MNVGEYLKENGIKPSIQRIKYFNICWINTHPTVDDIFQSLSVEILLYPRRLSIIQIFLSITT